MKVFELLTEAVKRPKAPKAPKPRPKKTLWFCNQALWKADLDQCRMGHALHTDEDEEGIFALDSHGNDCYGAWYPNRNMGVTFATPRPRHALVHPRKKIKPWAATQ